MRYSILIPVYNAAAFLRQCLDSVLCQRLSDYEVILVNDGSTDASPAICSEYARLDSRFRLIHQENQGLLMARKAGIAAARGSYLLFWTRTTSGNQTCWKPSTPSCSRSSRTS